MIRLHVTSSLSLRLVMVVLLSRLKRSDRDTIYLTLNIALSLIIVVMFHVKHLIQTFLYYLSRMKISKDTWMKIIQIIAAAIVSVLATLGVVACTLSLSIQKNSTNSTQKTEQSVSVDSTIVSNRLNN
ncbi:MAG: hypothetical protein [Microviridae sp.]|nr:MAG: hypothetical protein [Microviridae sp.]